ncbi:hypothetical protein BLOT_006805 [Blomia tropicalis]|nr:hypothetical protein BLOT_006805 [Blomia tropicalis]
MVGSNRLMVEMFNPIQGVIFYDQIDRIEWCKQIQVVVALINSTRSMFYDLMANRTALVHQQKSMLFTLFHSIILIYKAQRIAVQRGQMPNSASSITAIETDQSIIDLHLHSQVSTLT